MALSLRNVLLFGAQFVLLFSALLWIYPQVLPAYQPAVITTANAVLGASDPSLRVDANLDGDWQIQTRLPDGSFRTIRRVGLYLDFLYLNLVLLPALLLATPVRLLTRLRMLAVGLLILFAFHVAWVLGLVRLELCPSDVCARLGELMSITPQLAAIAAWGLLSWRHWLGRTVAGPATAVPASTASTDPPDRNNPCPCGSGKKHKHCCGATR